MDSWVPVNCWNWRWSQGLQPRNHFSSIFTRLAKAAFLKAGRTEADRPPGSYCTNPGDSLSLGHDGTAGDSERRWGSLFFIPHTSTENTYPGFLQVFFHIEVHFGWLIGYRYSTLFMLNSGTMKVLYLILYLTPWWLKTCLYYYYC